AWTLAFDNISYLPHWLSDAMCRMSTGGGFSVRTLYENDEETVFDAQRPQLINGIEQLADREDLLDRCLLVTLPAITDDKRRTEAEYWAEFEKARPRILGALLDAVSVGLRTLPGLKVGALPRMSDFGEWAIACEAGLGLKPG